VEGTIVNSNVPETFVWLRMADVEDPAERARRFAHVISNAPRYLKAERRDRGEFLRMFYKQYEGTNVAELRELSESVMGDLLFHRIAPDAVRRIREHRRAGHRVVFITGSLDFVVEPLRPLADEVITAKLQESNGRHTGDLDRPPLVGEARASWLKDHAEEVGADLSVSYAYADSMSDLPLLEAVGNPVAVNPDVALHRLARQRKWPVEEWEAEKGMARVLVPEKR
jgi:fatty acyl-CoA reductase